MAEVPRARKREYGTHPNDRLLTIDQTAEQLMLSRRSVYRLLSRGVLPSVRLGERLRRIRASPAI